MYDVVVKEFMFTISSPDEFLVFLVTEWNGFFKEIRLVLGVKSKVHGKVGCKP